MMWQEEKGNTPAVVHGEGVIVTQMQDIKIWEAMTNAGNLTGDEMEV